MSKKKISPTFTININLKEFIRRCYIDSEIEEGDKTMVPIYDYIVDENKLVFLDPNKRSLVYFVPVIGAKGVPGDGNPLPLHTTKPCWNCHSPFDTIPIGCPLVYHGHKNKLEYELEHTRIKEYFQTHNFVETEKNDWFETEGVFCSFPCVKRYIYDQLAKTKNEIYDHSLTLLTNLSLILYGKIMEIPVGNDFTVLEDYGGPQTPDENRENMGQLQYVPSGNLKRPMLYSSAEYLLEKRL